jgi:hypothetical protein
MDIMAQYARLLANARQNVNDLYRRFPNGVVRFDYESNTAKVYTDGVDEKVLIFGDSFDVFSKLARKAKKCETIKLLERMKQIPVA